MEVGLEEAPVRGRLVWTPESVISLAVRYYLEVGDAPLFPELTISAFSRTAG